MPENPMERYTRSDRPLLPWQTGKRSRISEQERQSQAVYDEVRLEALRIEGAAALGAHAMEVVNGLDGVRRDLAGGDEITNRLLADLEMEAIRQIKKSQARLFNKFDV